MTNKIIRYIVGSILIILSLVLVFQNVRYITILQKITILNLIISFIIVCFIFLFTGFQIGYITKNQYEIKLKLEDYFILPTIMHLWTYIVPFQGGLLFSSFFLNKKYQLKIYHGISIGIYTFFITLFLTGTYGIYFAAMSNSLRVWILSIFLILSPSSIILLRNILKKIHFKNRYLFKIKHFLDNILSSITLLTKNLSINVSIIFIIILSIFLYIFWFHFAALALGFDIPLTRIILVALITRMSVLTRFTPGNLGTQEFFSGGTLSLVGGSLYEGIVISLFLRFTALTVALIIGIFGMIYNNKYLKIKSLKGIYLRLKQYKN